MKFRDKYKNEIEIYDKIIENEALCDIVLLDNIVRYVLPCTFWCELSRPYCWELNECPLRRYIEDY